MGGLWKPSGSCCQSPVIRPRIILMAFVLVSFMVFGSNRIAVALQTHTIEPEQGSAEQAKPVQKTPAQETEKLKPQGEPGPAATPGQDQSHALPAPAEKPGDTHAAAPAAGGEHGGGHGITLPELSPIPGVTFVETLIRVMDHELHGRTLGWRPNDILIGRFTDNINNYQLGVLEAVRFTALRLKDSLTRMGDADTYDPDLEQAVNLFMNSATLWWFPEAESSYSQAIEHLKNFKTKLETGKRTFYYRRDNLVALLSAYRDQLGNVNRSLVQPSGWYHSDEPFYYAKGVAHVYYEILKVCKVGFKTQLTSTMHGMDIMDEILHELDTAENIRPWLILNGDLGGWLANHRANLNAPLSETSHLLVILSQL
ncbi:MAG: DUF2333 family protein [Syntrophobacter sp.]